MATQAVQPDEMNQESRIGDELGVPAAAFQALEQRVLRAIELLRKERELRAAAEQRANQAEEHGLEVELELEERTGQHAAQTVQAAEQEARIVAQAGQLQGHAEQIRRLEGDLSQLQNERDQVRQRVERLLQHLDEFTGA